MRYTITDTDIYGNTHWNDDDYQLVYGIFHSTQVGFYGDIEVDTYNLVASLCNRYTEPILRTAKIRSWIKTLDDLQGRLKDKETEYPNVEQGFYIPFFEKKSHLTIEAYINTTIYAKQLLTDFGNSSAAEYVLHKSDTFLFPLDSTKELLHSLQDKVNQEVQSWNLQADKASSNTSLKSECLRHAGLYETISNGIDWELYRRGLEDFDRYADLDDTCIDAYSFYYFHENYADSTTLASAESATISPEDIKQASNKLKVGVLLFMLESFGVKDKEQIRKIAHFALKHGVTPYKNKTNSNDTIYSYLHNDRQLFFLTNEIKKVLREYNVDIPEGLETLSNRTDISI